MKKIFLMALIIIVSLFMTSCNQKDEYVRLRIIANSNNAIDLTDKTTIKNTIKELFDCSLLSYDNLTCENLNKYLKETLSNDLYSKITIEKCISYYPAKSYKGKFIPSGNYETLLIKIDKGNGNNFWTLLYPEYFGYEFEESNEIEYRSYFYDKLS